MLNLRLARPSLLVDVSRLEALRSVEDIGRAWRIGAGVTHARLEDARGQLAGGEMLCEVAAASPIGRSATAARSAAALRTPIRRRTGRWRWRRSAQPSTSRGRRRAPCPVEQFIAGAFTTVLAGRRDHRNRSTCPSSRARGATAIYKFCRKTGEFAEASAAAVFDPEAGAARIFLGALRRRPQPLAALAQRVAAEGEAAASAQAVREALARSGRRSRCRRAAHGGGRGDARLAAGVRAVTPIALTVNGRKVAALVEPRTHLADFLREHCRLTGTHLGCEHGVCGACTVLIDGEPARSCITYAVACDGLADRRPSKASTTTRSCTNCARRSRASTRCNAASARPAC